MISQVWPPEYVVDTGYEIAIVGQEVAEVRKHFLTPCADRFTIDVPGPDGVEITNGEDDVLILASVLALALAEDRERERDR